VDSHFGHATEFTVYEVDEDSGEYEETGSRTTQAFCGDSCGSSSVEALSDVEYVLAAKIGPHAIRALAQFGVSAFDIALPVDEAIAKINAYRKKISARKQRLSEDEK
jgi:predicted Fe-Mo cluster-binding NifX family protein